MDVLSDAAATNGGAVVVFQDPVSAEDILAAFRADDDVIAAAIYLGDQQAFCLLLI